MAEFLMPSLGADMEAGKLVEWLVAPGAMLNRGDVVAVVETQKGAIEVETFEAGVFERPLVQVGTDVPVGTPIAVIRYEGEGPGTEHAPTAERETTAVSEPVTGVPVEPHGSGRAATPISPADQAAGNAAAPHPEKADGRAEHRLRASPAARRYALEKGIDLAAIKGSGPQGEIQLDDLAQRDIAGQPAAPGSAGESAGQPLSGMRAAIATAMARSKREIPHYYLAHRVDVTAPEAWLADYNTRRDPGDRLLLGALLVKAVARACKKYPEFNGRFEDGIFRQSTPVHAGVAINIRGTGLVAPAIHDVDALGIPELMSAMRDLVTRVRAGRFRASELSDPTITVSSLGDRGVETLFGVIYPPQVAIVGFGTPSNEVRHVDGLIGSRRTVHVTLAGDHRVSDGHRGALFLSHIAQLLQKPEAL